MKRRPFDVGIVSNDWHLPYPDKGAWKLLLTACEIIKLDFFVMNGDGVEFEGVTRHFAPGRIRAGFKREVGKVREYLDEIEAALPKKCEKTWLEGNHEQWLRKYIERNAEALVGFEEVEWSNLLGLKGWEVMPIEDGAYPEIELGKLVVTHGDIIRKFSGWAARAEVHDRWGSILVGHTHRLGAYYYTPKGEKTTYVGYENGCLLDFAVAKKYKKYKPNWQHGFSIVTVDPRTGWFRVDQIPIVKVPGRPKRRMMLHEGVFECDA